jgi:hypothetical protein
MAVYSSYTDEELKFDIGQLGKQLSNAEDEVRSLKGQIEYAQAELARREIDASLAANKDLPFQVGDKLLVTEECNAAFEYKISRNRWIPGLVVTVETIIPDYGVVRFEHESIDETIGTSIPIARRMREAWLASVQEAQG